MRLLLIVLLCLFTPLYFTALQAGDRRQARFVLPVDSFDDNDRLSDLDDNDSTVAVYDSDEDELYHQERLHALVGQRQTKTNLFTQNRVQTRVRGNTSAHQEESAFFSKITVKRLSKLLLFTNSAIKNMLAFHKATLEFINHPVSQITETGARILRDLFSGYYSHLHQLSQVYPAHEQVDLTTEVGSGMHTFHVQRTHHVESALRQHFSIKVHGSRVPKIACAISSGGMRACLSAAGFLAGAEQTGLLDCVMYNAAISGGSWAVGSASYLFATTNPRVTFTEYKNTLVKHLDKGVLIQGQSDYSPPYIEHPASNGMSRNFFRRVAWDQPITSMELWGALIANITLQGVDGWDQSKEGQRFDVKFSDIAVALQQGILPLPMLASAVPINSFEDDDSHDYRWMAFTPLRAGTRNIGGYLPMWSMGRAYIEGQNDLTYRGFAGEYSLSYLLGVSEPAGNVNLKYFSKMERPVLEVQGFKIPMPIDIADIADLRLYPYKIHNFTKDIANAPLAGKEFMKMVDGASCLNIPLPLVTKGEDTAANIIIIVDSDLDAVNGMEISETLTTINHYYQERNPSAMPELDPNIPMKMYREGKVFHMFNDPRDENYDRTRPVVVYFPLIRNQQYSQTFDPAGFASMRHSEVQMVYGGPNYLSTFNFKYTHAQAQELADLMEFNVKQSIPEITEMLHAYMKHHQKGEKQILDPAYKDRKPGISFDFDMN